MSEELVSDLRTSDDDQRVKKALKRADEYLSRVQEGEAGDSIAHDRSVINSGGDAEDKICLNETSETSGNTTHTYIRTYTHTCVRTHVYLER